MSRKWCHVAVNLTTTAEALSRHSPMSACRMSASHIAAGSAPVEMLLQVVLRQLAIQPVRAQQEAVLVLQLRQREIEKQLARHRPRA